MWAWPSIRRRRRNVTKTILHFSLHHSWHYFMNGDVIAFCSFVTVPTGWKQCYQCCSSCITGVCHSIVTVTHNRISVRRCINATHPYRFNSLYKPTTSTYPTSYFCFILELIIFTWFYQLTPVHLILPVHSNSQKLSLHRNQLPMPTCLSAFYYFTSLLQCTCMSNNLDFTHSLSTVY